MSNEIIIAVLSCIGTISGSLAGVLVSNRLTTYRIEQLEKKLDKFTDSQTDINDDLKERVVVVEQSTKSAHKRIDGLVTQLQVKETWRDNE
jgi:peptidoglycan hydrolase CwlO-like protein